MWLPFFVTTCFALAAHGFTQQDNEAIEGHSDELKLLSEIHNHLYLSSKPINKVEMPTVRKKRNIEVSSGIEEGHFRNKREDIYMNARTRIAEHVQKMQQDILMLRNLEYEKRKGLNRKTHEEKHPLFTLKMSSRKDAKDPAKKGNKRKNILRHIIRLKRFEKKKGDRGYKHDNELRGILKKPGEGTVTTKERKRVRIHDDAIKHEGREKDVHKNLIKRERRSIKKKASSKKVKKPRVFLVVKKIPFMKKGHVEYKYIVLKKLFVGSALATKIRNNKRFVKKEKAKKIGILWKPPAHIKTQVEKNNVNHVKSKIARGNTRRDNEEIRKASSNSVHRDEIKNESQNNKKRSFIPRPEIRKVKIHTEHSTKFSNVQRTKSSTQINRTHLNKTTQTSNKLLSSKIISKPKISHTFSASGSSSYLPISANKPQNSSQTYAVTKPKSLASSRRKNNTANKSSNILANEIRSHPASLRSKSDKKLAVNRADVTSKGVILHRISNKKPLVRNHSPEKDSTTKLLEEVKNGLSKETQTKLSASVRQLSRCSNARKKLVDLFQMVDLSLKRAATLSKIIGQKFGIDPKMIEQMTSSSEKKAVEQFLDTLANDNNEENTV